MGESGRGRRGAGARAAGGARRCQRSPHSLAGSGRERSERTPEGASAKPSGCQLQRAPRPPSPAGPTPRARGIRRRLGNNSARPPAPRPARRGPSRRGARDPAGDRAGAGCRRAPAPQGPGAAGGRAGSLRRWRRGAGLGGQTQTAPERLPGKQRAGGREGSGGAGRPGRARPGEGLRGGDARFPGPAADGRTRDPARDEEAWRRLGRAPSPSEKRRVCAPAVQGPQKQTPRYCRKEWIWGSKPDKARK